MIANAALKRATIAIFAIVTTAIIITACSSQQQGGMKRPPTPVEFADVTSTSVVDKFAAVGTVEAAEAITVVTEIDAIVIDLPFAEGQPIEKGGVIAQLDDSQLRAELASAEATRDQAKVTFERVQEVVDAGAAAKQELDNASANLKVAQARLDQARVRLDKARIVAPFSGVLGTRRVSPGAYLRAGDAITTLTQIKQLKVTFSAPERVFPLLSHGASVIVSSPAYPDYQLEGKIDVIDPVVNQTTRSVQVIARVKNEERKLRPGMSADVTVDLRVRPSALTIPDEAVFAEGNQSFVYVVKPDSSVARTAVSLGSRQAGTVEVVEGLKAGQKIVRAGHQKLFDGAKVMPAMSGAPKGAAPPAGADSAAVAKDSV